MQQRMFELEEESDRLLHAQSECDHELKSLQQALEERQEQNKQLQEDCKSMTIKLSSYSKEER